MKYIDSHVHIGDADLVEKYVTTSPLRNQIRLYSALTAEVVKQQEAYLRSCERYLGLPIILKEITIPEANAYLENFAASHTSCLPAFLVGDEEARYQRNHSRILKEHFLHHSLENLEERKSSYAYLNSLGNGYLLIHSLDLGRIEYIQMLRKEYPHMKIIIAHMGRNVYEEFEFSKNVIDAFRDDEAIWFDTSTIKKEAILQYALQTIGDERILFGTDFPYECQENLSQNHFFEMISRAKLTSTSYQNILYHNAKRVMDGT